MADLNKFEKMLELLVNENKEAAQELFHEIVVEKSRDIYESLLEDEDDVEEATDEEVDESDEDLDEADDEEVDESDEDLDENFSLDSFEVEGDDDMGGDPTDDMMADLGMDDEGEEGDMDDEGEEGDVEDRVEDLEDALEDLKAEFEKMMAGDDGDDMDDEEGDDMDMGGDEEKESFAFESDDEEVDESADEDDEDEDEVEEASKTPKSASEQMREYVEKVSATMGDNGVNNKSTVAGPNNMGGTSANIARGDTANDGEAGAGSKVKGSALNDQNAKEDSAGNINVPGGKASKSMKSQPGHGAEKKGKPETADKAATSTLNKVSSRAK